MFARTAPINSFSTPTLILLLRPNSIQIMLRSVPTCRYCVEFSREFRTLLRAKFAQVPLDTQILSRIQYYSTLRRCSCRSLRRSQPVAELRGAASRKISTKMLHPCYTRYTLKKGCKPFVLRRCHTVTPYFSKFPVMHARIHTLNFCPSYLVPRSSYLENLPTPEKDKFSK